MEETDVCYPTASFWAIQQAIPKGCPAKALPGCQRQQIGLEALPRHETAHGALLADIVDLLRGERPQSTDTESLPEPDELSPSELRVLRYLPTNMTRPEIARELYVSVNTVNTHMRNIYAKLGAHDRSSAVQRARDLRLVAAARS